MDQNFVKKFLKASISTSAGTLASVAFHFLSITLMARFTTKEALGLYFLIIAIANGGKILSSLGLDLTLVQFLVSEQQDIQQQTFAAVMWIRLLTLVLFTAVVYLFGSFVLSQFDENIVPYKWSLPVLFALMSFRELFFYILQGLQNFRSYAVIQTISALLKCILIGIFIFSSSLDLMTLINIEFLTLGSSLLLQFWVIPFKSLSPPRLLFDTSILPRIFRFGLPLYANSTLSYISNYGAVFIISVFLSPLGIAAYEVARKIPEGLARFFNSFRVVYFPSLSSLFAKGDFKNGQKLVNKSLTLLAAGTFALVLFSLLFRREIVIFVFSDKYLEVQTTFVVLMLSVCFHLLAGTMGYSLVSAGHPKQSMIVNIIAMGLELLLSLLLIPQVGYFGAAISYVVMTLLSQVMCYFYLRQAGVDINLSVYLRPFILLGVISTGYLLIGYEALLFRIAVFGVYVTLSLLFIPECRRAINFVLRLVQERKLETGPVRV
ncbi:MAG: oligosaccharide flippase family protein [Chloroflexi bacterium]|nr:oligosaccharide flippase family protein [Chloroflexota bacterium]